MQKLTLSQIHECCLNIAKVFDSICKKHNIPYYMLGGTMLGAIRHKGFIPWDDDMDFGVPIDFYDKLTDILKNELPSQYRCCTFLDHPCVFFPFIKIEDTYTVLDDISLPVENDTKIGINIDVFPLFYCSADDHQYKIARLLVDIEGLIFTNSRNSTGIRRLVKRILRSVIPFNAKWLAKKSLEIIKKTKEAPYLFNAYGRWSSKECIPAEWYGYGKEYIFEDCKFLGLSESHSYLTHMYGNYMDIPPLSKRDSHCVNAYKKLLVSDKKLN